jgi:hypothetical protein
MIRLKHLLMEDRDWTGEAWKSCKQWNSHKGTFLSGAGPAKISIGTGATSIQLKYEGPGSGLSIAHADRGSGDTLHQLFNVIVCELNPKLANVKMKPVIDNISTNCIATSNGNYEMTISIPFESADGPWQLNHRGKWSKNDPGPDEVKANVPEGAEISRNVTNVPGGNSIYTYFATYPLK